MKVKIVAFYRDGSETRITCREDLRDRYVDEYKPKPSVVLLTSRAYPFKDNKTIVHKDIREVTHETGKDQDPQ